ncbi:HIT domain-containing protein [Flocculibacter collagenilyticus]|uniref:HIT domain-containing protein n=1 Tax=Flocculibacter collagenilyticus TaxID=2744479 RepID=UPI0018F3CE12|nr:HIT domain-containing protein [Flocculibacter collagenilyticus]
MNLNFSLDPRLENDTVKLATFPLCELLLMNDSQYPWCILVPRVDHALELMALSVAQQHQFLVESNYVSQMLTSLFEPDKLNIAALGNVVSQLHIHHVARFKSDISWPAPIWGAHPVIAYTDDALVKITDKISEYLQHHPI